MIVVLVTVILLLIAFVYYIKWSATYYSTLDIMTYDQETKKTVMPDDKRSNWKYYVLPPRSVADSYGMLNYEYNYYKARYL